MRYQWLGHKKSRVFDFFCNENNLSKLTPKSIGFKVLGMSTEKIQTGTIIKYKLKLAGIPFYWSSKIHNFKKDHSFSDEQLKGPYKSWYHTHSFHKTKNGTLVKDYVEYTLPFGALGSFFAGAFIKFNLKSIFNYRQTSLKSFFPHKEPLS